MQDREQVSRPVLQPVTQRAGRRICLRQPPDAARLSPDETLVLINGKRVHRSALVQVSGGSVAAVSQGADLSQIPSAAIR